jgi:hypothetical protein
VEGGLLQREFPLSETRHLEPDIWNLLEDLAQAREQEVVLEEAVWGGGRGYWK